MQVNANNLSDLPELIYLIHDKFFDLDQTQFDSKKKELKLFLGTNSKGPFNQELVVKDVVDYHVHDSERIGIYGMNVISIKESKKMIYIKAEPFLKIVINAGQNYEIIVDEIS